MEIRVLNYFLTVIREGSMNKAADVLHITQPTLSRQIAGLEEEVGVKLFARTGRNLQLTNEGILLRRRAEEILSLVDRTEKELLEQDDQMEGQLVIGGGELSAMFDLAGILEEFHKKYPLVTYDLITANADETKDQIEKGLVDIGVLLEPIEIEKFDFVRIESSEKWVAAMRADDPLTGKEAVVPDDLTDYPIILPRRKNVQNEIKHWFGDSYEKLDVLFTSNLNMNGAVMVSQGLARSIIAEGPTRLWDNSKLATRPLLPEMRADCVFAWKKNQPKNLILEKFIEFTADAIKVKKERQEWENK